MSNRVFIDGLESRVFLSASIAHAAHAAVHCSAPAISAQLHQHSMAAGSVVSVDTTDTPNTITVSIPGRHGTSTNTTYNVDPAATITADGGAVALSALTAGVKVKLTLSPTDSTTVTAITAVGGEADGTVSAVDTIANTISLTGPHGGLPNVYTLGANATITLNGTTATLGDITTGAKVELKLSALNGTTVLSVNARTPKPRQIMAFGSVVSVDTTDTPNTITVSIPGRHGTSTNTTYNVDPAAIIMADGSAVALGALPAGVDVKLSINPADTTTVTAITAIGQQVDGMVSAVDAANNTITLTGRHGGTPTTYTLGANATITLDGATVTLADITAGASAVEALSAERRDRDRRECPHRERACARENGRIRPASLIGRPSQYDRRAKCEAIDVGRLAVLRERSRSRRFLGASDSGEDLLVNLPRTGNHLPYPKGKLLIHGHDHDRADAHQSLLDGGIEQRAGDFPQRAIEDLHVEDAGKPDNSHVGQDIEPAHPLERGPHEPASDHENTRFHRTVRRVVDFLGEDDRQDHEDDHNGQRPEAGEQDEPARGTEQKLDDLAIAQDVPHEQRGGCGNGRRDGTAALAGAEHLRAACALAVAVNLWRGTLHGRNLSRLRVTMSGTLR